MECVGSGVVVVIGVDEVVGVGVGVVDGLSDGSDPW